MIRRTLALLMALAPLPAAAQATWITLGTGSGPIPNPARAQPANLLVVGDAAILVDAGDGAVDGMAKAGVPLTRLRAAVISHLHADHTGGLFALLARRYQLVVPGVLEIYGPPGTRATVDGLLAAMAPALGEASNVRQRNGRAAADTVRVTEIADGWSGPVGGVTMTVASNSHYILQGSAPGAADSYAVRFDTPGRRITYTGDTGPSAAVERLARGADLLVSEIMDPDASLAAIRASRPDMPAPALAMVEAHFRRQHLAPAAAGEMAARAGVKALVLTHSDLAPAAEPAARAAIGATYRGRVAFARDLGRY